MPTFTATLRLSIGDAESEFPVRVEYRHIRASRGGRSGAGMPEPDEPEDAEIWSVTVGAADSGHSVPAYFMTDEISAELVRLALEDHGAARDQAAEDAAEFRRETEDEALNAAVLGRGADDEF